MKDSHMTQRVFHCCLIAESKLYVFGGLSTYATSLEDPPSSGETCPLVCRMDRRTLFLVECQGMDPTLPAPPEPSKPQKNVVIITLPEGIVVEILSFLTLKELKITTRVCKQWYLFSQHPSIVRHLLHFFTF